MERKKDTTTSILPLDVIEIILSKLPVKSLLKFKTVCKSWQAIISDPRFSQIFNIQQCKSQNLFLVGRHTVQQGWPWGGFSLIKWENKKFRTEWVVGNPVGDNWLPWCSCNGIVLLKESSNDVYALWNPSIGKYSRISRPHRHARSRSRFDSNCGLYYDSKIDDYKVVVISSEYYAVFSCKSGSWAKKRPSPCKPCGLYPSRAVFVDGSFYWWLFYQGELVGFDVREEKLKTLQPPDNLQANGTDEVRLIKLSGRLCLYRMNRYLTKLQLWVMEKERHAGDHQNDCWRELMKMEREEADLSLDRPICLTSEDNVVIALMSMSGSRFVVYNHGGKRFEESQELPYDDMCADFLSCSETLFLPTIHNIRAREELSTKFLRGDDTNISFLYS